jgi:hypothetical protein
MWLRGLLLAVVASAVFVPAASAKIVLQKSIGGVSLGMTRAQVTGLLGAPARDVAPTANDTRKTRFWDYSNRLRVGFANDGDVATIVVTKSRSERTASGVGVGSSRRAVKRALHGEYCVARSCMLGNGALGEVSTGFLFNRRGRAIEVYVFQREDTYLP